MLVRNLSISEERKTILIEIATAFDSGLAFPRTSDVKSFLAAHSAQAREVRSRDHAFRLSQEMISEDLLQTFPINPTRGSRHITRQLTPTEARRIRYLDPRPFVMSERILVGRSGGIRILSEIANSRF